MNTPEERSKNAADTPTPAIVTPLDEHMGLDIARALGPQGIPVYGLDPDPHAIGKHSQYCQLVVCPDLHTAEDAYVQFLVEFGKTLPRKAVLYPTSDDTALLCSRVRQTLQPYYEFVMPPHPLMVRLATKGGLATLAEKHGIPAPRTLIPQDITEVETATTLHYPVILKPVESSSWHHPAIAALLRENLLSGRAKVVVCHDEAELLRLYRAIAAHDNRLIIQEVIPGPDENLAYCSFYLDRHSRPLAMFAGRKLRVLPVGFGSASYVRSFVDAELQQNVLQLLSAVQYQGLGGIEFKKDPRDGRYKLIEFNTRFGMWDGLAVRCGVNTPYVAYRDTLGMAVTPQLTYREQVIWLDWQRDVRAFWMYRRQGQLTWRTWLRSLRGEKMWAIYSGRDWRPGLAFTLDLAYTFCGRILAKFKPAARKG